MPTLDLEKLLSKHFCEAYNIDINSNYVIEKVKARDLIVANRLDLIAKIKYVEFKEKGYNMSFVSDLYKEHIEAFSLGSYKEPGNENKNSIQKYFAIFNNLIENIKTGGINEELSLIPVGKNNTILDGAHRIAIAAYFDMEVPIIRFEHLNVDYDSNFFRRRLLKESYIDYLVTEYCKIKKGNIYFACVWPRAKSETKRKNIVPLINRVGGVVYEKDIEINYCGLKNLITQIYSTQQWIGNIDNNFRGAKNKVDQCYGSSKLKIIVFECESLGTVISLKKQIRDIFNLENHSIHITDNKNETVELANLLLNRNSLNLLNYGNPYKYKDLIYKVNLFKKTVIDNNLHLEDFVIDSSSIMGLYGLRNTTDIDFMTTSHNYKAIENTIISNHHKYIDYYKTSIDDLVYNPQNYLVFSGIKFVTLEKLKLFKTNRNEPKDKIDVELIKNILEMNKENLFVLNIKFHLLRLKRNLLFKMKKLISTSLKCLGIYNLTLKLLKRR